MGNTVLYTTAFSRETQEIGERFAREWGTATSQNTSPRVMCLFGDLGSGKTTFMQGVAAGFGIASRLLSPTFIIIRKYDIPDTEKHLIHADLYRINTADEIAGTGLLEMLNDESNIICIEWAERLGEKLPKQRIEVHCAVLEEVHTFTVTTYE